LRSVEAAVTGRAVDANKVHGQPDGGGLAAVVNVNTSFAMVLPAVSVAPLTVTAYLVLAVSCDDGVKVRVRLAES
jgi:hypothetical protein